MNVDKKLSGKLIMDLGTLEPEPRLYWSRCDDDYIDFLHRLFALIRRRRRRQQLGFLCIGSFYMTEFKHNELQRHTAWLR
jgi:hypothetical protein